MEAVQTTSVRIPASAQDAFETLLRKAQSGDQEAFGKLYEMFRPRVAKFLFNATRDYCLADELSNDTFFRAHRALADLRRVQESSFLSFLFRIAANLLRDHHRRKKLSTSPMEDGCWESVSVDTQSCPESWEHLQSQERSDMLHQALAELSAEQSTLITLSHFQELSAEQIAQILGKPSAQAVRAALHRAMKHLHKQLLRQGYFQTAAIC